MRRNRTILTEEDRNKIKELLKQGVKQKEIAQQFNVVESVISAIKKSNESPENIEGRVNKPAQKRRKIVKNDKPSPPASNSNALVAGLNTEIDKRRMEILALEVARELLNKEV